MQMIKKRNNYIKWIVRFFGIFAITTLTQDLYSFQINQIVGGLLILLIILNEIPLVKKKYIFLSLYCLFSLAQTFIMTDNYSLATIETIRFISFILLFMFIMKENNIIMFGEELKKQNNFLLNILILGNFVILFSLFRPESYSNEWGSEAYFKGYTSFFHTMASVSCLLLSLALVYLKNNKFKIYHIIFLLIPVIAIVSTGARTFIIPLVILMFAYIRYTIKKVSIRRVMYVAITVMLSYVLLTSSMADKFLFVSDNPYVTNKYDSFTNGRNKIWLVDIQEFLNNNLFYKLFGKGFTYSYELHKNTLGQNIWSHSDIFNILVCGGIAGLLTYIYCIYTVFYSMFNKYGNRLKSVIYLLYITLPAVLNGFYEYQHYVISAIVFFSFLQLSAKE